MSARFIPLEQACDFLSGYAWSAAKFETDVVGLPIIRIQNVDAVRESDFVYWGEAFDKRFVVREGDLLLTLSGSFRVVVWPGPDALLNQRIVKLMPKEGYSRDWLLHVLRNALSAISNLGRHALVSNVALADLRQLQVPLQTADEQRRIAAILDQAETLRTQRRTALAQLDSLTQSIFLDMFGDPVANPKGFQSCLLGEIIEFVGGSQPAKEHFSYEPSPESIRLVQIRDFRTDEFKTYIPKKLARRFFDVDDVMIGRYGPPVFQIFRGLSGSYNVALMKALPKQGALHDFIFFLLQEPGLHGYVVDRSTRTAGQSGVNLELLESYPAYLPPLTLQQTFATRIQAIEALKATHRSALTALDALFASLQQRAFAGQL